MRALVEAGASLVQPGHQTDQPARAYHVCAVYSHQPAFTQSIRTFAGVRCADNGPKQGLLGVDNGQIW